MTTRLIDLRHQYRISVAETQMPLLPKHPKQQAVRRNSCFCRLLLELLLFAIEKKEIFLQPSLIITQLIRMYMKMDTRLLIKTNTQSSVLVKCSIKEGA